LITLVMSWGTRRSRDRPAFPTSRKAGRAEEKGGLVLASPCSGKKYPKPLEESRDNRFDPSVSDQSTSEIGLNANPVFTARRRGRQRPFTPTGGVGNLWISLTKGSAGLDGPTLQWVKSRKRGKSFSLRSGQPVDRIQRSSGTLSVDYCERVSGL
jgi:hypothetical protein